VNNNKQIEKKIDKIFDKHTKMLTQTTLPDGENLVSFDVVVQDIFETKKELSTLLNKVEEDAYEKGYKDAMDMVEKYTEGKVKMVGGGKIDTPKDFYKNIGKYCHQSYLSERSGK
jgi:hypothetical protein